MLSSKKTPRSTGKKQSKDAAGSVGGPRHHQRWRVSITAAPLPERLKRGTSSRARFLLALLAFRAKNERRKEGEINVEARFKPTNKQPSSLLRRLCQITCFRHEHGKGNFIYKMFHDKKKYTYNFLVECKKSALCMRCSPLISYFTRLLLFRLHLSTSSCFFSI